MNWKTIWSLRVFWFTVGFMTSLLITPSKAAQSPGDYQPRVSPEFRQLFLEGQQRQFEAEAKSREKQRAQDELEADQKEFRYSYEMAALWTKLAQDENQFYAQKWNGKTENVILRLEIKSLKDEINQRLKKRK